MADIISSQNNLTRIIWSDNPNIIRRSLKRKKYDSKKARDILDDQYTEFANNKRNISEFFNIYSSKFYNITTAVHAFFSKESLKYVPDYVNPKVLQVQQLEKQLEQLQIDIDSIEGHHPIFPNNSILTSGGGEDKDYHYHLIQSGRRRRIYGWEMILKVKGLYRHKDKPRKEWTIDIGQEIINGIPSGPNIRTEEDLILPLYTINTGKELPSNIYIG